MDIGRATFAETFGHLYPPEDLADFLGKAHSAELTRRNLTDPRRANWLVEADGEVVGYALAGPCGLPHQEVTRRCGELKRIYLLKGWQNGGLGLRLAEEALAWLEQAGRERLWIGVWSENHGAQRFYGRLGFKKVGEYEFRVGRVRDREFILSRSPRR